MKTLKEITDEILAANPSRFYVVNDEEFEQTDEEFEQAVKNKAEMMLNQQRIEAEKQENKQALLDKLGITEEELRALL